MKTTKKADWCLALPEGATFGHVMKLKKKLRAKASHTMTADGKRFVVVFPATAEQAAYLLHYFPGCDVWPLGEPEREYLLTKPNRMFSPEKRALTRFVRFKKHQVCPVTGKKDRIMWTQLVPFKATTMEGQFGVLRFPPKIWPALTPVWSECLLKPIFPKRRRKK